MDKRLRFVATEKAGEVSALLRRPRGATHLYVLAHGAGAGMTHPFMQAMAERLAEHRIATFRFQFPYTESGRRRPDHRNTLLPTVRAAVSAARKSARGLPVIAGGKSMGGRMTSVTASDEPLPGVRGLVFLGFPLHPPGKVGTARGDHLDKLRIPMLFLQGTRDKLADPTLIEQVHRRLGRRATLHMVENGDHGFHVLKRSGRTDAEALAELAQQTADWCHKLTA